MEFVKIFYFFASLLSCSRRSSQPSSYYYFREYVCIFVLNFTRIIKHHKLHFTVFPNGMAEQQSNERLPSTTPETLA